MVLPTCTIQVSYGTPTCEVSSCLIWLLWSPIPLLNRYHMVLPIMFVWSPHIWNKYCMVPQCTYGPPFLIWNKYHMVFTYVLKSPHMWSVFMSYMTLMVPPYLIWNRYHMVCHMYIQFPSPYMQQVLYRPPTCMYGSPNMWSAFMSYMTLTVPHTSYGIGIIWSLQHACMIPLPYMEQLSYGPPHVKCLHVLYDLWFPYLIWNRYCTVPHKSYMILIVLWSSPYLIWNRYHIVPPHVKCLHVLHDYYGPPIPYLERYKVPHMYVWSPYLIWNGPLYLIWNRYHMVPPCMYGPPTCMYGPPYIMTWCQWLLWSPIPYIE